MMTIADACILASCLLPVLCAALAKSKGFGQPRRVGGFDNNSPREWLSKLQGWQARANAAQQNSFETLPIFIAGVLIAQQLHAPQVRVDDLAILFVVVRLGYVGAYITDKATLRSILWAIGLAACIALYFVG